MKKFENNEVLCKKKITIMIRIFRLGFLHAATYKYLVNTTFRWI